MHVKPLLVSKYLQNLEITGIPVIHTLCQIKTYIWNM